MVFSPKTIPIERYLAIDLHKEYLMIGGMNAEQEWVLRPRRIQMSRFRDWSLKNLRMGDAVVIETTSNVWDIYDIVSPLVTKAVVAHAGKVRQIAEARVKTDKEDVRRLLTLLIANIVPEVWVPPMHVRELRSLISFRWRVSKQIVMSKNRLHSVIQRFNLHPPEGKLLADKNKSWWDEQNFTELTRFQVEHDLEIVEYLEEQKAKTDRKLAKLSDTEPWASEMVYLMQIPGFGPLFSMITLSAIGDISRFDSPKKLVGYAGLGAGIHASGKKYQEKSITKEGRRELRWALVEAAWGAMRSDPYWKAQYQRLSKVKHPSKAIVAIARRLLVSVWHILTKREAYHHFDEEGIAYKMLIWSQRMDEKALNGLTRQQFVKYCLLRIGVGQDLTRIVRNGLPRRIAPSEEVLALRPELRPPE
ncbi:MAG: IS110 family transposase [Proteobacteria bacterium]|nr:IS110 family transposase [Pseudomonadota bacterium]